WYVSAYNFYTDACLSPARAPRSIFTSMPHSFVTDPLLLTGFEISNVCDRRPYNEDRSWNSESISRYPPQNPKPRRRNMEAPAATVKDPRWKSIVRSLAQSRSQSPERILSDRLTTPTAITASNDVDLRHAKVDVLERASPSTVIISWHDPTRCSYRFQLWRRLGSTRSGVCALSGTVINAG